MATMANSPSNMHSPWAQVVRGDEESAPHSPSLSSSPAASRAEQTNFSDCSTVKAVENSEFKDTTERSDSSNKNAARPKKPAWNKPSNEVVDVNHVVDAVSWPALSDSTRVSSKSPSDSPKNNSDASVSVSQGLVTPISPQKQVTGGAKPSSTLNHTVPVRQRSMRRGSGPSRSNFARPSLPQPPPPPPPPPPLFPVFRMPPGNYGNLIPVVSDLPTRVEPSYRGNNRVNRMNGQLGPQLFVANSHPLQRNTARRGNFGPQHRGDSSPQVSTTRDVRIQPHRAPPRGFSPPPNNAAFTSPQPVRPFGNPMGTADMMSQVYVVPAIPPESFRDFPFVPYTPPPPAMPFPIPDFLLPTMLVNQINYYFSDINLITDVFLKSNMDDNGWVPITVIARFPRVGQMTKDIQFILHSLQNSTVVEVQGDKVRKRNEWMKWIPTSGRFSGNSSSQSSGESNNDMLTGCFQKAKPDEEVTVNQKSVMVGEVAPRMEEAQGKSSYEQLNGNGDSLLSNVKVSDPDGVRVGSE